MRFIGRCVAAQVVFCGPIAFGQDCFPVVTPTPGLSVIGSPVSDLHVHDDGSGSALYACGFFESVGSVPAQRVARWDGTAWSAVGQPPATSVVRSLTTHLGKLAAGSVGNGPTVMLWDGSQWETLATGASIWTVSTMSSYAGDLYVAGNFTSVFGGVQTWRIARWDGAAWHGLGSGFPGPNSLVDCLFPFESSLLVGGQFSEAGGVPTFGAARWDGAWHAMSAPMEVGDFHVHGGSLYAAGNGLSTAFTRWTGAAWEPLPSPFFSLGRLTAWRGQIYGLGAWSVPLGQTDGTIGRWNGQSWGPVIAFNQYPTGYSIYKLEAFQDDLYMCGNFVFGVGGVAAPYIARMTCSGCYADCDGSGALSVADFACFQSKFLTKAAYADCTQDYLWTVADFGCYQTKYVQGCP